MENLASVSYQSDYYQWTKNQLKMLQSHRLEQLDVENLIEEVEEMGRRERRSVESNLVVLLTHLIKWKFQSAHRSGSWKGSIKEHRRRLNKDLQESPSLMGYAEEQLPECYEIARTFASGETGLEETIFPEKCPYSLQEILNSNFWPESSFR